MVSLARMMVLLLLLWVGSGRSELMMEVNSAPQVPDIADIEIRWEERSEWNCCNSSAVMSTSPCSGEGWRVRYQARKLLGIVANSSTDWL